jgi:short-subunit dehydrogenase involved in D-alanine esterification of teichoic acids
MDLGDLGSIREFVDATLAELPRLDQLINYAGTMACLEEREVGSG